MALNFETVLKQLGPKLVLQFQQNLTKKMATGELENSFKFDVIEVTPGRWVLSIKAAKQLEFIEKGRRAGAKPPPMLPIRMWIGHRGIQLKKGTTAAGLAFVIAKSIGIKGIKPFPVISRTIKQVLTDNFKLIETASQEELLQLVNSIMYVPTPQN